MTRRLALGALLAALVALAGWLTLRVARPRAIHLPDGIIARPLTLDGRVEVTHLTTDHLALRLAAGGARFTVPPGFARTVTVDAGAARVVAEGGAFEVYRATPVDGGAIEVTVDDGAVRVHAAGAIERLTASAHRRYAAHRAP